MIRMPECLLSICIPTYNGADMLGLALATSVPQAEELCDQVECIVSDNASTDETESVVAQYLNYRCLQYSKNPNNLGAVGNIEKLVELAKGEFIWIIGDDDTINTGGVKIVVDALQSYGNHVDLVVLNFLKSVFSARPMPDVAKGGIREVFGRQARTIEKEGLLKFEDLLDGEGGAFTPIYSLVIRRRIWVKFFSNYNIEVPYTSIRSTYPHAVMLGNNMVGKQVYYIASPTLTLFSKWEELETFGWKQYAPLVLTLRLAELLRHYEKNGVAQEKLIPYYKSAISNSLRYLSKLLWRRSTYAEGWGIFINFIKLLPFGRIRLIYYFCKACTNEYAPYWVRLMMRNFLRAGKSLSRVFPWSSLLSF